MPFIYAKYPTGMLKYVSSVNYGETIRKAAWETCWPMRMTEWQDNYTYVLERLERHWQRKMFATPVILAATRLWGARGEPCESYWWSIICVSFTFAKSRPAWSTPITRSNPNSCWRQLSYTIRIGGFYARKESIRGNYNRSFLCIEAAPNRTFMSLWYKRAGVATSWSQPMRVDQAGLDTPDSTW